MNVCKETFQPVRTRGKLQIFIIFTSLVDLHTIEVPGWGEAVDLLRFDDCFPDLEKCLFGQNEIWSLS